MSNNQDSSPIAAVKKKVKHLHSILKVRVPDITLGECYNIYSRLERAKDWNALCTGLKKHSRDENPHVRIETFIDETLRPMMVQIGNAHSMEVTDQPSYGIERIDSDKNGVHSQPMREMEVTFRPKGQKNTDCSFRIEVGLTRAFVAHGEMTFVFPESAYDAVIRIFSSKQMPYFLAPSLLRALDKGKFTYCLALEIEPFSFSVISGKEISGAADEIEYFRHDMDETIGKYAELNKSFRRLAKQWGNKKTETSFETALWKVFTGKPRYMSASPEFHRASFGSLLLTACISKSGPYIAGPEGYVDLGVCSVIHREADGKLPEGYYIAKYGNYDEPRIHLKGVSGADIPKITAEFGVPPGFELAHELNIPFNEVKDEYVAFFRSRAFPGLQKWVSKNRSFAKKIRRQAPYIPDWYERATGQHPIPDSDEDLAKAGDKLRYGRLTKSAARAKMRE